MEIDLNERGKMFSAAAKLFENLAALAANVNRLVDQSVEEAKQKADRQTNTRS